METVDEGVQLLIIRCTILAITSKRNFGPILNRILYRSRWICAPRRSPFNSITHFERKPRLRGTISATKSVSKYQYWWSFVTLELSKLLSNESYGKQRENGYFYLSVALKRAQLFSFLFPLLSRSAFSSPLVSMFRVRFTRTRNSYFLFRTSTYTRTSTMGSGGLTHRWPTIASNTSSFAQWFHAPPCTDPRIRIGTKRVSDRAPRFDAGADAGFPGLTFPIMGRPGFWKTPARLPRVAWSRTWCTSRQDAPGRTCTAFCDNGRSECATGTCTMATWCEVSSNFLRQKCVVSSRISRRPFGKYGKRIEFRLVSRKNFQRNGKRASSCHLRLYIAYVRGETDKEKQKKVKLEAR